MSPTLFGIDDVRQQALDLSQGRPLTPSAVQAVAKIVADEWARWAFSQWELRERARAKFVNAHEMLFVKEALEQATHEQVANYHASRFPTGELVADMTAGIGADLIALARRGPVEGYELDPARAELARHNLSVHGLAGDVIVGDSLSTLPPVQYAFADPARRVEGRRTLNIDDFSPSVPTLAKWMNTLQLGGIKLSPMLSDQNLESVSPSLEFVSFHRECREALCWLGTDAVPGRWAIHVESGERLQASREPLPVNQPFAYLYEADPAAIRAHCLGPLCDTFSAAPLADSNGYLTGNEPGESPWLRSFRVLYSGPGDLKKTKAALRKLGAKPILKQRGAAQDLNALAKAMGQFGERPVFVALYPLEKSIRHAILESVSP